VKPVKQQFRHFPEYGLWGDCHRACIASILELPLEEVPHFCDGGQEVGGLDCPVRSWLDERGLFQTNTPYNGNIDLDQLLHDLGIVLPGIYFILGGSSRNGVGHSLVAGEGRIVHDPSIDGSGCVGPMEDGLYWVTVIGRKLL